MNAVNDVGEKSFSIGWTLFGVGGCCPAAWRQLLGGKNILQISFQMGLCGA